MHWAVKYYYDQMFLVMLLGDNLFLLLFLIFSGQAVHVELTKKAADVLEENERLKKACHVPSHFLFS